MHPYTHDVYTYDGNVEREHARERERASERCIHKSDVCACVFTKELCVHAYSQTSDVYAYIFKRVVCVHVYTHKSDVYVYIHTEDVRIYAHKSDV